LGKFCGLKKIRIFEKILNVNNIQTKKKKKEKNARFFKKNENKGGKGYFEKKEKKREMEINCMMLPKQNRLRKEKEIKDVLKNGKIFKTPYFNLYIKENQLSKPRFAFLVPKKFFKKAVKRNEIKRFFRMTIRKNLEEIKKGIDVVLFVKKDPQKNQKILKECIFYLKNF